MSEPLTFWLGFGLMVFLIGELLVHWARHFIEEIDSLLEWRETWDPLFC